MTTLASSHLYNRAKLVEDVIATIDQQVHSQLQDDARLDAMIRAARPSYTPTPACRRRIRAILAVRYLGKPLGLPAIVNALTEGD